MFPEGLYYDRKNQAFRTERVNEVFGLIAQLSSDLEGKEKGTNVKDQRLSLLAERAGFEPRDTVARIQTFQACSFNHSDTSPKGRAKLHCFTV